MIKNNKKIILLGGILLLGIFTIYQFELINLLKLENFSELRNKILSLGIFSVLGFFGLYILSCIFMLPGLPVTLLGGALFGPLFGSIYTILSASIGLACSFLIARYGVRDILIKKFNSSNIFKKINEGVAHEGWRMLIITRLVPIFPFSLQNYLYGLTNINFFLYWTLSTLLIIPGTVAYTMSFGAVLAGEFSTKNLVYLGLGAFCFVLISFLPKIVQKVYTDNDKL